MKLYDCKLRLAGNVMHEVFKGRVTAAEIEIFRFVHGEDAVVDTKEVDDVKRSSAEERNRLKQIYANPEMLNSKALKQKQDMLRSLFGHDRAPLPEDLAEIAPREEDEAEDAVEAVAKEPVRRTRVAKPDAPTFAE